MMFHPFDTHSATNAYPQGFHNDGFWNLQRHLENHDHMLPRNFSLNSHGLASEVPNFHVTQKTYHALPYADPLAVPGVYERDPWTNGYSPTLPDGSRLFRDNTMHSHYDTWNGLSVSDAVCPSFRVRQQPDREHGNGHVFGVNPLQFSDPGFADSRHARHVQPLGNSANRFQNDEFINRAVGDCLSLPYSHSVSEIVCGTETPPARGRDGDVIDIRSLSPYRRSAPLPIFDHTSFAQQPYVSQRNFSPNIGLSSCAIAGGIDYGNFSSKDTGCDESLPPVRPFFDVERTSSGFDACGGRIGYTDPALSSPTVKKASSEDVVLRNIPSPVCHSAPRSRDKPLLLGPSASNFCGMKANSVDCGRRPPECSVYPEHVSADIAHDANYSRSGFGLPAREHEQVRHHVRETDASVTSAEGFTFNTSTSSYCRDWEMPGDRRSENNVGTTTSAVPAGSAVPSEVNIVQKYSSGCQQVPAERTDTDSFAAGTTNDSTCTISDSSDDDDDDVIVISLSPVAPENAVPCSTSIANSSAGSLCDAGARTAGARDFLKDNRHTCSEFCSFVPNSAPSTSAVNANAIASQSAPRFPPSVPFSVDDIGRLGNCEITHDKRVVANGCIVPAYSCSSSSCQHSNSQLPVRSCAVAVTHSGGVSRLPVLTADAQERFRQSELQRRLRATPVANSASHGRSLLRTYSSQTVENYRQNACAMKQHILAARSSSAIGSSAPASCILPSATIAPRNQVAYCNSQAVERDHQYVSFPSSACLHGSVPLQQRIVSSRSASEIAGSGSSSRVLRSSTIAARNEATTRIRAVESDHQYGYFPGSTLRQNSVPHPATNRHIASARPASEIGSSASGCRAATAARNEASGSVRLVETDHQNACAPSSAFLRRLVPQPIPRPCAFSARSAEDNGRSVSSGRVLRESTMAARNNQSTNFGAHYQYRGLPVYRRVCSVSQLGELSARKHGTFSLPAAQRLLQKLKQPKLPDFVYARGSARQPTAANQRFYQMFRRAFSNDESVIDLTADDDDPDGVGASCESMFARVRWRDAGRRLRRYMQWKWLRRTRLACVSSGYPAHYQAEQSKFSVDKSLPFYRCFVQKLLRNYRIGRSFVSRLPPRISPELPPAADHGVYYASKVAHHVAKTASATQPVVVLERLDKKVLEQISMGKAVVVRSSASRAVSATASTSNSGRYSLQLSERVSQELAKPPVGHVDEESVSKDDEVAKTHAKTKLLSRCRPLSVVLDRLDESQRWQICKGKDEPDAEPQDNQRSEELPVEPTGWTVTRIPRPDNVPMLIIRLSVLKVPVVDNPPPKATGNRYDRPGSSNRQLRSSTLKSPMKIKISKAATKSVDYSPPHRSGRCKMSQKRALKKAAWYRKLSLTRPVLPNLRSRNFLKSRSRRRASTPVFRSFCEPRSRRSHPTRSKPVLLPTRCNTTKKMRSDSMTEISHKVPSVAVPVDQDVPAVPPSQFTPESMPTNVPTHDSGIGEDLADMSDSNTICVSSPRSLTDDDATIVCRSPAVCADLDDDESTQDLLEWAEFGAAASTDDKTDVSPGLKSASQSVYNLWNCSQTVPDAQNAACASSDMRPVEFPSEPMDCCSWTDNFRSDFDDNESTQDLLEWAEVCATEGADHNVDSGLEPKLASPSVCDLRNCGQTLAQPADWHNADVADTDARPIEFSISSEQMDSRLWTDHFGSDPVFVDTVDEESSPCCWVNRCADDEMEGSAASVIDVLSELADQTLRECDLESFVCAETGAEDSRVSLGKPYAPEVPASVTGHDENTQQKVMMQQSNGHSLAEPPVSNMSSGLLHGSEPKCEDGSQTQPRSN